MFLSSVPPTSIPNLLSPSSLGVLWPDLNMFVKADIVHWMDMMAEEL